MTDADRAASSVVPGRNLPAATMPVPMWMHVRDVILNCGSEGLSDRDLVMR